MKPDVYVSDDGGYTWIKALEGPHHYAILDSGGLLVAVEENFHQGVNQIKWVQGSVSNFWCLGKSFDGLGIAQDLGSKILHLKSCSCITIITSLIDVDLGVFISCLDRFSTDEGQCWHVYNFTKDPIFFTGLASEPGARSMNVSLWGYRSYMFDQYWISFTIDFRDLITKNCEWQNHVLRTTGIFIWL